MLIYGCGHRSVAHAMLPRSQPIQDLLDDLASPSRICRREAALPAASAAFGLSGHDHRQHRRHNWLARSNPDGGDVR